MNKKHFVVGLVLSLVLLLGTSVAAFGKQPSGEPNVEMIYDELAGFTGAGSTIGPGGALFVTEGEAGRILRIDPKTDEVSVYASGLPMGSLGIGIGGPMDVAFIGGTAYALVTLVGEDVGGDSTVGIYRIDGPDTNTPIADIGLYSTENEPPTEYFVPSGVQYALETYRGGFLVTDGHHNRVLRVTLDGDIETFIQFENTVPTGLEVWGDTIYMAEAGPVPHLPGDGKVVSFRPGDTSAAEVASGAKLNVDVEIGLGRKMYALSQGTYDGGGAGARAVEYTGALMELNGDGSMSIVVDGLNQPTSFEFFGNTAYVFTLSGAIYKIENVSGTPFGISQ